jgi:hypothetical protein
MAAPLDLSEQLRAVWDTRRVEQRREACVRGGSYNVVFGAMGTVIFVAYALVQADGLDGPWVPFAWVPPVLASYLVLAFWRQRLLGLARPALDWRSVLPGTALMFALFTVEGAAYNAQLLRDEFLGAGMAVGAFYVLLGLSFHDAPHTGFGSFVLAAAAALLALGVGFPFSALFGIVVVGGGMVAMGLWMLRSGRGGGDAARDPGPELAGVRDTLRRIQRHEDDLAARGRALRLLAAAVALALAGVFALGHGEPVSGAGLVATGALVAGFARWQLAREGADGP